MTAPAKKNDVFEVGKVVPFRPVSDPRNQRFTWFDWLALALAVIGVVASMWGAWVSATG